MSFKIKIREGEVNLKSIDKLKEKLNSDKSFKELFINIKTLDEAIDLARQHGFDVDQIEVSEDEGLTDNILEAVAGGKGQKRNTVNTHNYYVE